MDLNSKQQINTLLQKMCDFKVLPLTDKCSHTNTEISPIQIPCHLVKL